jgi:predicted Abi (CAAX) family protease
MISEIIWNKDISTDFETDWLELELENIPEIRQKQEARSLQIEWQGATGVLNGVLDIIISNNQSLETIAQTINITSASNSDDCVLITFDITPPYLKVRYQHNGITGGSMNAALFYKEIR